MAKPEKSEQIVEEGQEKVDLRGSLTSVLIMGAFILLSWLGVWYIFITR